MGLKKVLAAWADDINQFYAAKAAKEFSYENKKVFFRIANGAAGIGSGAGNGVGADGVRRGGGERFCYHQWDTKGWRDAYGDIQRVYR
jgi:hypothetical protein